LPFEELLLGKRRPYQAGKGMTDIVRPDPLAPEEIFLKWKDAQ